MKRISRSRLPRFFVVLFCVLLLGVGIFWRHTLGGFVWYVAAPLALHNPLAGVLRSFHTNAQLAQENEALRAELASTTAQLADRGVNLRHQASDHGLVERACGLEHIE